MTRAKTYFGPKRQVSWGKKGWLSSWADISRQDPYACTAGDHSLAALLGRGDTVKRAIIADESREDALTIMDDMLLYVEHVNANKLSITELGAKLFNSTMFNKSSTF